MRQKKQPEIFRKIEEKAKLEALQAAQGLYDAQKEAYLADLDRLEKWGRITNDFALLVAYIAGVISTDASYKSIQQILSTYNRSSASAVCVQATYNLVKFFRECGLDDPYPDSLLELVSQLGSLTDSLTKVETHNDTKLKDAIQQLKEDLKPLTGFWYDEAIKAIWNKGGRPKQDNTEIFEEALRYESEQKALGRTRVPVEDIIAHCQSMFSDDWLHKMKSNYKTDRDAFRKMLKKYREEAEKTVFSASESRNLLR